MAILESSHLYASGQYTDTETTLRFEQGTHTVWVKVRCLPGLSYWERPPADVMRKWVDALIKDEPVKRDGARVQTKNRWFFNYYLKAK